MGIPSHRLGPCLSRAPVGVGKRYSGGGIRGDEAAGAKDKKGERAEKT